MGQFLEKVAGWTLVRKIVYSVVGLISYPGLKWVNRLEVEGMAHLHRLPKQNVLFVSNHQTYFADVITFLHIFCAASWGKSRGIGLPYYLLWPFTRVRFVAAEETMKKTGLTRLFSLAGAILIKRTWRDEGQDIQRQVDPEDLIKIEQALKKNWLITFPQGTTRPFAPGRKGTAHLILQSRPLIVPVVISGFWRAFDKKGLRFKKTGSPLRVRIKEPLQIDYALPVEELLGQVMSAIEQDPEHWEAKKQGKL